MAIGEVGYTAMSPFLYPVRFQEHNNDNIGLVISGDTLNIGFDHEKNRIRYAKGYAHPIFFRSHPIFSVSPSIESNIIPVRPIQELCMSG